MQCFIYCSLTKLIFTKPKKVVNIYLFNIYLYSSLGDVLNIFQHVFQTPVGTGATAQQHCRERKLESVQRLYQYCDNATLANAFCGAAWQFVDE